MAEYRYGGPGPEEHDGELAHPGDVREFGAEPGWGLWELIPAPEPPPPPPVTAVAPAETPDEGTEGGM